MAQAAPCLALLTEVGVAKSGVFRSLNDPSLPLSSHLIRASPGPPDAAELWQDAGGWMSLLG